MSLSSIGIIMYRIKSASAQSKIAVFLPTTMTDLKARRLESVFANTVATQKAIKDSDPLHIGTYSRYMDPKKIRRALNAAIDAELNSRRKVG